MSDSSYPAALASGARSPTTSLATSFRSTAPKFVPVRSMRLQVQQLIGETGQPSHVHEESGLGGKGTLRFNTGLHDGDGRAQFMCGIGQKPLARNIGFVETARIGGQSRFLNVDTGVVLQDEVQWAPFTSITWTKDGSGFFYSRFPKPEGRARSTAGIANHAIYFHALGKPQAEDRLIYANPEWPELLHLADISEDGHYLLIASTPGAGVNGLAIVELTSQDWPPAS